MPDLKYQIEGAEPQRFAVAPTLLFKLRVAETVAPGAEPTPIHTVALRCQIRIEPGRRSYLPEERERLLDLFGTPERWGQTLRPMPWTHITTVVPPFQGEITVELPVPCSYDFTLPATKYFAGLEGGDLPLCFLFSGTIFYEGQDGSLQVSQISWEKEASFRLPTATWRSLMDLYYPNSAWLCLRKDVFDQFDRYRSQNGLTTPEHAMEQLLASTEEPVTP